MGLVLVTGKGGVGKTTLAAATALLAAERGARTLLVSTDAAHSLADVLETRLGAQPSPVAPNLDGVHLDGRDELERHWSVIADYLRRLVGWSELDRLHTDELMVVPGLEQLLALAHLRSLVEEGSWDAIVVDCAPSADSLRLLTLPDVARWYIERIFGRGGVLAGWGRRRAERVLAAPMPGNDVVRSVTDLADELGRMRDMFATASTTVRIVVSPERMVIAEAQRTLTYLALYGYLVDAVLVNRVMRPAIITEEMRPWIAAQEAQLEAIDQAFSPLPQLAVSHRMAEPIGIPNLRAIGHDLYGPLDPLVRLTSLPALEISSAGEQSVVRIPVHGVHRDDISLDRWGDDLVVTLGMHRRRVRLPDMLRSQEVVRAGLSDGHLEVVFGQVAHVG